MSMTPSSVLRTVDESGLRQARRLLGPTPAVPVARALSHFGEHALGWLAIGSVGLLAGRRRDDWADMLIGVVGAHAAGVLAKRVVRRPRPRLADVPPLVGTPSRLSFPSAHSCSTAAAAVGLAPFVGGAPVASMTAAMLVSRVLLGVHYPSDVVAGAAVGGGVAVAVRRARRARRGGRS